MLKGHKILLIEDDEDFREITENILSEFYDVTVAETGKNGLSMAAQILPDLILIDLSLPDIDGLEITNRLKNDTRFRNVPIIAFTSRTMTTDKINAFDAGCDDYIMKPVKTNQLLDKIRTILLQFNKNVEKYKILLVDDDEDSLEIIGNQLEELHYEVFKAKNGAEAIHLFKKHTPDLVISDIMLPVHNGFELCRILRTENIQKYIPIILITAKQEIEGKIKGLKYGADDYLIQPINKNELAARIKSFLRFSTLHKSLQKANEELNYKAEQLKTALASEKKLLQNLNNRAQKLEELSITDDLTGLFNHRHFKEYCEKEFKRSIRYSTTMSLIMLDINSFKSINDIYGHQVGDLSLKFVAKCILKTIRNIDFGARYGGDEFIIVLPNTDNFGAIKLAKRLHNCVSENAFKKENLELKITVSIGIATLNEQVPDFLKLVEMADQAMYIAKKNEIHIFNQSDKPEIRSEEKIDEDMISYLRKISNDQKKNFLFKLHQMIFVKQRDDLLKHLHNIQDLLEKIQNDLNLTPREKDSLTTSIQVCFLGALVDNEQDEWKKVIEKSREVIKNLPIFGEEKEILNQLGDDFFLKEEGKVSKIPQILSLLFLIYSNMQAGKNIKEIDIDLKKYNLISFKNITSSIKKYEKDIIG